MRRFFWKKPGWPLAWDRFPSLFEARRNARISSLGRIYTRAEAVKVFGLQDVEIAERKAR